MKHCQSCNLDFPDTCRFCGSCGGALSDARPCPGCGELIKTTWTFCTKCGRRLSSEAISGQASSPEISKPAEMSAPPPSSSSTPRTPPPRTLILPDAEPLRSDTESSRDKAAQYAGPVEWYASADPYEAATAPRSDRLEEKAYPPSHSPSANVVRDSQSPNRYQVPDVPDVAMTGQAPPAPTQALPVTAPETSPSRSAPTLSMMESYGRKPEIPSQFRWWHGATLGLVFLLFVGGLGIGGWYWWSHRSSATPPPSAKSGAPSQGSLSEDPSQSSAQTDKPTTTSTQTASDRPANEEFRELRDRRINGQPSESSEIIAALEKAEKKYPNDYRFPYERAKLSIKGIVSHHEAFGALALSAERAIDNGQAQEMLDSLMADKDGDFYKLSRGHREWQALVQALRSKDKAALRPLHN